MLGGGKDFYALPTPNITGQLELEGTSGDRVVQHARVKTAASPRFRRKGWQAEAALLQRAVDAAGKCGRTVGRGWPCMWHSHSSPRTHAPHTKTSLA